jgi:hypothetical protein
MAITIPIVTEFMGSGIAKARKEFAQLEGASAKAGFALKKAFIPATAAIAGMGAAMFDAAKGAMEDDAAAKELARSLKATTNATDAVVKSTENWISQQGKLLGISDSQLRPTLSRLARATGDVDKAQRLATQAMDIAAATGKPLETVVGALEKAYGGNMTALQRLAPEYRTMIKDGADFETVMAALAETTGGAATEAANTAAGRMERLKVQIGETQETIGAAFLPMLEKILPVLISMASWVEKNSDVVIALGVAFGGFATAIIAARAALVAYRTIAIATTGINALLAASGFAVQISTGVGIATALAGMAALGGITYGLLKMFKTDSGGSSGTAGGSGLGGGLMGEMKGIPAMANGGIVTGPTLALIGEGRGPEAVIPLNRMKDFGMGGGNNVTINVQGADPNAVVDALRTYMFRNGSVPIRVA